MEALAQATEGDEGAGWEAACGHLAEGFLKVPRGAVTFEASHQQVDTGTPILADAGSTTARAGAHFAVLTWGKKTNESEGEA